MELFGARSLHCVIRTARLTLTPVRSSDGPSVFALLSDPRTASSGCATHTETRQSVDLAEHLASDPLAHRAWLAMREQAVVGLFCLFDSDRHVAQLAFFVAAHFQRQGYGTEAVEAMLRYGRTIWCLREVHADTAIDNLAACALLRKVGFANEGTEATQLLFRRRF